MAMGDTYYDIEYGNEAKLIAQDPELIAKSFFKSKKKVDPEPVVDDINIEDINEDDIPF